MKKGERVAMVFIGVMMTAIIGSTVYMEMDRAERAASKTADATDNRAARLIPTGLHPADLPDPEGRGAKLMGMYCVQCHELPDPHMHTPTEWVAVLARMDQHMLNQGGGMIVRVLRPSDEDARALESYVQAHALKPLHDLQHVDFSSAQGSAFKAVCAACHALPDPAQHTASDWRRVVARMMVNMSRAGLAVPDESRLNDVLAFLQQGAATN